METSNAKFFPRNQSRCLVIGLPSVTFPVVSTALLLRDSLQSSRDFDY